MLSFGPTANSSSLALPEQMDRRTKPKILQRRLVMVIAATGILALCAHISFLLPFTPVPVTMQTFGVLLTGMLLGPVAASAAMVLYLAEGALGLPVFSPHGPGGLAQLAGTSAGYLLAYPFAALIAGRIFAAARGAVPTFVAAVAASLVADALILASGATWLGILLHTSARQSILLGATPFLVGELYKVLLTAATMYLLTRAQVQR